MICVSHEIQRGFHPHRTELQKGGQNLNGKRFTEFAVSDSEYADATAIPFTSRSDAEIFTPLLMEHFRRWGLEVHAGSCSPHKESKTEILFCARPHWSYQDKETFDDTNLDDLTLYRTVDSFL